jgi:Glycosyl transferase family 2
MRRSRGHRPALSLVVVAFDIPREIARTLQSLSADYQRDLDPEDYEVVVVDNGSTPAVDPSLFDRLAGNFRLLRVSPAPPSPARAVNLGLAEARGEVVGVMIDGARLVTPGLLRYALQGARLAERAVVATLGWHIGFDSSQFLATEAGYDAAREDALLDSIDWPSDGYRLFEIGALDASSSSGWFTAIGESNALFLPRRTWELVGGADERFDAPGGGLLNASMYDQAMELPGAELVVLLGEGTFQQVHGGIATNADMSTFGPTFAQWAEQYRALRGRDWGSRTGVRRTLVGTLPRAALAHFTHSALNRPNRTTPLWPSSSTSRTRSFEPAATRPPLPWLASLVLVLRTSRSRKDCSLLRAPGSRHPNPLPSTAWQRCLR